MEYRILGSEDIGLMHQLMSVFGRAFVEVETYESARPDAGYLADLLGSPWFIAVAAIEDSRVVGGLAAYVLPKFEQARSEVYLYDLAVDEPYRRRGIATRLIETLSGLAAARGADVIFVQADRADEPAVALYSRLGVGEDVLHFDLPVHRPSPK